MTTTTSSGAHYELVVLVAYILVIVTCAWGALRFTDLPDLLAALIGAATGLLLALFINALIVVFVSFFRAG